VKIIIETPESLSVFAFGVEKERQYQGRNKRCDNQYNVGRETEEYFLVGFAGCYESCPVIGMREGFRVNQFQFGFS